MLKKTLVMVAVCVSLVSVTSAVVIETVPVGDPGNTGELSGLGAGGYGPDRVCGSVDYVYDIGKYEVTTGQYCEFLNAVAATDTHQLYNEEMRDSIYGCKIRRIGTSGSYRYLVDADSDGNEDPDWVDRPVNYVSWGDAIRFCNWLTNGQPSGAQDLSTTENGAYFLDGAVDYTELMAVAAPDATQRAAWSSGSDRYFLLPSEDEWYKAAHYDADGGVYYDYPTGTDATPSNDLTDPDLGNSANYYQDGFTIGGPHWRTEVGEFESSASPYGTFDQGGNVNEWTEAIPFLDSSYRGIRGGIFGSAGSQGSEDMRLKGCWRNYGAPQDGYYYNGFRVSEVPEPATLSLLAFGGLALVRRRRQ